MTTQTLKQINVLHIQTIGKWWQWLIILGVIAVIATCGFWLTLQMISIARNEMLTERQFIALKASRFSLINAISTAKHSLGLVANNVTDKCIIQVLEVAAKQQIEVRVLFAQPLILNK